MSENKSVETGVTLPEDGIIDTQWAQSQIERVSLFSAELLNYGKGEIFTVLRANLSTSAFEAAISDLGYTVETSLTYISYLQKRPILEAIKAKYFVALSLSAAEYIPDSIEDAMALLDVCIARFGRPTADNLRKAAETTGTLPKKLTDAALSIETLKKKALLEWLLSEHLMSEEDYQDASRIPVEGKIEFQENMLEAYSRLGDWSEFYKIIATTVHTSNSAAAMRFLADINDASPSIMEFLAGEKAFNKLNALKQQFESEVYPELSFQANQD